MNDAKYRSMRESNQKAYKNHVQATLADHVASEQARRHGGGNAGYVRPHKRRKATHSRSNTPQPNYGSSERLERDVICGKLWHRACRSDGYDLPQALPVSFQSSRHYIQSYESLIFEEARESILQSKVEPGTSQIEVTIQRNDALPSGWSEITLTPNESRGQFREGGIMILSSHKLPPKHTVEWYADLAQQSRKKSAKHQHSKPRPKDNQEDEKREPLVVAGVVKLAPGIGRSGDIILGIHPQCEKHTGQSHSPCTKGLEGLRPGANLWALIMGPLVTQQREFTALHKIPSMAIGCHMLWPEGLADIARQVERAHPDTSEYTLSRNVHGEGILNKMTSQYDATQFQAIVAATRHLDLDENDSHIPRMPVVLICGPPGTGKTHTVTGILNIWHLSHYTQHQDSITARLRLDLERGDLSQDHPDNEKERVAEIASKPKLLVCAPSNAAADEILQRVMTNGFIGNDGRQYFPNVVRVGAPGANIGDRARAVLVDSLVEGFMNMDPNVWRHQVQHLRHNVNRFTLDISALKAHLASLDMPAEEGPERELAIKQELNSIRQLVERYDARSKHMLHLERLYLVGDLVNNRAGMGVSQVKDALELSFVQDAEMVFTTLSSTGRKVFTKLKSGHYETVLIDEAAQASEVTTLQALTFGCQRIVLVGDPQQLPATILSKRGKDLMFERSLFERLQTAGCPVHTLEVQYRMHPYIRDFPSRYFYHNRLMDGQSVMERPEEVFYRHKFLKPYVFFDVSEGRDYVAQGGANSGSRRNQAEADLAVALFQALREELLLAVRKNALRHPVLVGVITPYREQVTCIKQSLDSVLGPDLAKEVDVSTVDSYQGRQLDVIILSAVRSNPSSTGVGFLNDVRRLNVSITRAKKALWILGSAETLRQSDVWNELIEDAEQRGALIPNASARSLFPDLPQFQTDYEPPGGPLPRTQPYGLFRTGNNAADQQLQDSSQANDLSSARMMAELEKGTSLNLNTPTENHQGTEGKGRGTKNGGIPGLDPPPTEPSRSHDVETSRQNPVQPKDANLEDPFLDKIFADDAEFVAKASSGQANVAVKAHHEDQNKELGRSQENGFNGNLALSSLQADFHTNKNSARLQGQHSGIEEEAMQANLMIDSDKIGIASEALGDQEPGELGLNEASQGRDSRSLIDVRQELSEDQHRRAANKETQDNLDSAKQRRHGDKIKSSLEPKNAEKRDLADKPYETDTLKDSPQNLPGPPPKVPGPSISRGMPTSMPPKTVSSREIPSESVPPAPLSKLTQQAKGDSSQDRSEISHKEDAQLLKPLVLQPDPSQNPSQASGSVSVPRRKFAKR